MVFLCIFLALSFSVPAAGYIVNLVVIEGEHSACNEGYYKVKHNDNLNGDLNEGAHGHYIWLCVKEGLQDDVDPVSEVAITASSSDADRNCNAFSGEWSLVEQGYDSNGDLNHGAGGKYIYMCIKRDKNNPLASLELSDGDCDAGYFRTPVGADSNGDLNQGAGGKYIYLCLQRACVATHVQGQWAVHGGQIVGTTKESWTVGTSQTHSETKTEDWQQSVTEKVSAGFSLVDIGATGSVEITAGIAHTISTSFSSAWTQDDSHTYEVTYGSEDIGKQPWQFFFAPSDSCGNTAKSAAQTLAITAGAWEQPCCAPGYSTDGPAYRICESKDALIPNALDRGCRVATQLNMSFVV